MHTLTCKKPWDYPVLQRWQTIKLVNKYDEASVHYGYQDGIPVAGFSYRHGPYKGHSWSGGGCAPGRKWGEYHTIDHAILETLLYLRDKFQRPMILKMIDEEIARRYKPIQLRLF